MSPLLLVAQRGNGYLHVEYFARAFSFWDWFITASWKTYGQGSSLQSSCWSSGRTHTPGETTRVLTYTFETSCYNIAHAWIVWVFKVRILLTRGAVEVCMGGEDSPYDLLRDKRKKFASIAYAHKYPGITYISYSQSLLYALSLSLFCTKKFSLSGRARVQDFPQRQNITFFLFRSTA